MKRSVVLFATLALASAWVPAFTKNNNAISDVPAKPIPIALLDGGRRLDFVRFLSSEQELHEKRSWFSKVIEFVAGAPTWRRMVRPYSIVTDSHGRLLVTDPGARAVHIFDFEKKKYTAIEGGKRDSFFSPIGITVDSEDNIYVTDSQRGKIFVFDPRGKYRRTLGDIKGEGFYKRPTGIAYDKSANQLFVTDTLRERIYVTNLNGQVLRYFGTRGQEPGQFNFPTEVVVHGDDVLVVDAMNFRVEIFNRDGVPRAQFGSVGGSAGQLFRPKGLAIDSEGHIYLVDAYLEAVQVFTREGLLLYSFGRTGARIGEFELPSGIWIDGKDRVYVADSYNHRIQVFQFVSGNHKTIVQHGEQN